MFSTCSPRKQPHFMPGKNIQNSLYYCIHVVSKTEKMQGFFSNLRSHIYGHSIIFEMCLASSCRQGLSVYFPQANLCQFPFYIGRAKSSLSQRLFKYMSILIICGIFLHIKVGVFIAIHEKGRRQLFFLLLLKTSHFQ